MTEHRGARPDTVLVLPDAAPPTSAVLVLSGSSGLMDVERARLFARHGAAALTMRWFGDVDQPPGICEVPLETFTPALDRLAALAEHLAVVGVSKGAEAALLLAAHDPRVRAVAAFAPTTVVWANVGAGLDGEMRPLRSSWSRDGRPLPFVPYDPAWSWPDDAGAPAFRGWYEQSLITYADRVEAAAIPVETIEADVVVTGGGDDQVWQSDVFATQIAERRRRAGLPTRVIVDGEAGHRMTLPGEPAAALAGGMWMRRGGSVEFDAAMGARVWPWLREMLRLTE